jgi:hypothetical protein
MVEAARKVRRFIGGRKRGGFMGEGRLLIGMTRNRGGFLEEKSP